MWKRMIAVFCCFCLGFTLLYMRLLYLVSDEELAATAIRQSSYTVDIANTRGNIYDSGFVSLVNKGRRAMASVYPTEESLEAILPYVENKTDLEGKLEKLMPFACELSTPNVKSKDITVFTVPERYQKNQLAPHIIGYTSDGHGVSGLELAYDELLRDCGSKASITYYTDGARKPIPGLDNTVTKGETVTGGVVTTLDCIIQAICERAAEKFVQKGAIVVMDPYTGELKAVVSAPDYSPASLKQSISDAENTPMINRAFSAYSLGSIFKLVTAATALEEGIPTTRQYTCTGSIEIGEQKFKCHLHTGHGTLDMEHAIIESCNTYFIDLAQDVNSENLVNIASAFSFGKGAALAGTMRSQSGYLQTTADLFNPAEKGNLGFGQGKLTATPLQVTQLTASIVNGGRTPQPILVRGITEDGKTLSQVSGEPAFMNAVSEKTAKTLKDFMVSAVEKKEDIKAKPTLTTAGGKTATAQTGKLDANGNELLQTWFTGFFPADKPKYVVTVLVEDGTTGNASAGPVFQYIADEITRAGK